LGSRLGHSLSPLIHEKIFDLLGIEASYELIEVPEEDLAAKVKELSQSYAGLNVTIPHKVAVMKSLDEVSDEAAAIGAVNTVLFRDGRATGYNTDCTGFAMMLLNNGIEMEGRTFCVLGTGGASRAVLYALSVSDADKITVVSRDKKNAPLDLREKYEVIDYDDLKSVAADVIVNTTPVGMFPHMSGSPVDASVMEHFASAVDIVYNPPVTRFMDLALKQGKTALNGLYMLAAQAVAAEEIWLDKELDYDMVPSIEADLRRALAGRK